MNWELLVTDIAWPPLWALAMARPPRDPAQAMTIAIA